MMESPRWLHRLTRQTRLREPPPYESDQIKRLAPRSGFVQPFRGTCQPPPHITAATRQGTNSFLPPTALRWTAWSTFGLEIIATRDEYCEMLEASA